MSELRFKQQMREAVIAILSQLPDRELMQSEVECQAMASITLDGQYHIDARTLIRQLIRKSPRCYGVNRKSGWWKIVLAFLTEEEAVRAYLMRFPQSLTDRQSQAIVAYLVDKRGFDFGLVSRQLKKFGRRQRLGCRSRERHCHGLASSHQ